MRGGDRIYIEIVEREVDASKSEGLENWQVQIFENPPSIAPE